MAVIVFDNTNAAYNGLLSTANGAYRAEAYNLNIYNGTLTGTSPLIVPVTFANAGNIKGVIFNVHANIPYSTANLAKRLKVTLQHFSGSWSDTTSTTTLTWGQMSQQTAPIFNALIPFKFAVTNAVNTNASEWRFTVTDLDAIGGYSIMCSDASNPCFVAWCDTQVTPTSTADALIIVDPVTIDTTFVTKGYLSTGETINATCGWVCRTTDATLADTSMFKCLAPAAPYTFTFDGAMYISDIAGVRFGTSILPIPLSSQLTFVCKASPTVGSASGTTVRSGFATSLSQSCYRADFWFYGEIPAVTNTTLTGDAAINQATLNVTSGTGFAINDTVYVGKSDVIGQETGSTFYTPHTISNVVGNVITLGTNLTGHNRKAGGHVIKTSGFGIIYTTDNLATSYMNGTIFWSANNFHLSGVNWRNVVINMNNGIDYTGITFPSLAKTATSIANCFFEMRGTTRYYRIFGGGVSATAISYDGITVTNCLCSCVNILDQYTSGSLVYLGVNYLSGTVTVTGCITQNQESNAFIGRMVGTMVMDIENNFQENGLSGMELAGLNTIFKNNNIWGIAVGSGGVAGINIQNNINCVMSGNTINKCTYGINFNTAKFSYNLQSTSDSFGQAVANTYDIGFMAGHFALAYFTSVVGNVTFDTTNATYMSPQNFVNGTNLAFINKNVTTNADSDNYRYGILTRTGYSLADTTVWTGTAFGAASAGQFGMRFAPASSTYLMTYQDNAGSTTIGNSQNKTVTVTARVKINNAAYYAGVHTKPTLKVTYDGTTVVSSVATGTTADQQLQVVFTPTTTNQAITIEINGATDATSTNAYFYVGELLVGLAGGISVDTTNFGSWKSALPLGTTRTFQTPNSAWDEPIVSHTVGGSFGVMTKNLQGLME